MKKIATLICFLLLCLPMVAQQPRFIFPEKTDSTSVAENKIDTTNVTLKKDSLPSIYAWRVDPRYGDRIFVNRDTLHYDFHAKSLVDNKDVAVGYLGNLGSTAISKIYFNQPKDLKFSPLEGFEFYRVNPEDHYFLNTKEPYSRIYYQSAGGGQNKEEDFKVDLSMNFGKRINVGANVDYLYARGYYQNSAAKQFNYDIYGSYIGDQLQVQAFFGHNYFNVSENGGLLDDGLLSITPSIPAYEMSVRMQNVWNRFNGKHFFLTGKYDLGIQEETGIPIASLIYTTHYNDQRRALLLKNAVIDTTIFAGGFSPNMQENMGYWSFKNTFAIALNEGFRSWTKFGLKAFVEQDIRKYVMGFFSEKHNQSETKIGGKLSKQRGTILNYDISADVAVTGYNLGEFNLLGDISTSIPIKGKYAQLKAQAYIKNHKPSFFQNNYSSFFANWQHDFGDIRRVYLGGQLNIPHTNTRLRGGVENIDNLIYVGENREIAQHGGNVQVVSLALDQRLKAGILHWDNEIVFQTSSNDEVLPLPKLSVYSNLYIEALLAKVLKLQLGFDARYHSSYYAPGYNPLTTQFYNQREVKVGNFPITTAYANLHLQKTRFFLMLYNVTGSMGDMNYFSLPHYPVNPMVFKFGLSWDFAN